jgi:hypothetical protein
MVMADKQHIYGQHVRYAAQKNNLFDDPRNNNNSLTYKTPLLILNPRKSKFLTFINIDPL